MHGMRHAGLVGHAVHVMQCMGWPSGYGLAPWTKSMHACSMQPVDPPMDNAHCVPTPRLSPCCPGLPTQPAAAAPAGHDTARWQPSAPPLTRWALARGPWRLIWLQQRTRRLSSDGERGTVTHNSNTSTPTGCGIQGAQIDVIAWADARCNAAAF